MIKYDQHIHTYFSGDSSENPEVHIKKAIELKLDGLCFTDHMDLDYPYEPAGIFEFDTQKFMRDLGLLKNRYENQLYVGRGIEIGLRNEPDKCEDMKKRLNDIVEAHKFDLVIGSVHMLEYKDLAYEEFWRDKEPRKCLEQYFEAGLFCAKYYDNFDVFGHLDYAVRYAPGDKSFYSPLDYFDLTDELLKTLIEKGKCLEVNTKSLKPMYGLNASNPGREVIKRYLELGGQMISVGSDAHRSDDLAGNFAQCQDILKDCGVEYITVFKKRKPQMVKL